MKFRVLLVLVLAPALFAQSISFQYFYDDANELFRVIDSTGTLIEYIYDPAGNITQINRSTIASGSPAIFNFTPLSAGQGSTITVFGQNFSTVLANDIVKINGVTGTVLSATATQLVIQVPAGATAGQITVTVNGVTVSSGATLVFSPLPAPVITSITPDSGIAGTVSNATVNGENFAGAIFSFPAGATAAASNVTPASANLQVTAMPGIRGIFPLIATTSNGSSTSSLTAGNQFFVLLSPDEADTQVISVLNTADPISQSADPTNISNNADSPVVSVLNTVDPISQSADPTNISNNADSPVVSVLNTVDPISQSADPTNVSNEADSALVSLNNSTSGSFRTPLASPLSRVTSFAEGTTAPGVIEIGPTNTTGRLVAGQTLVLGVRAPIDTTAVQLLSAGIPVARSTRRPYLFTLQVPRNAIALDLIVVANGANGSQLAARDWAQPVDQDAGTVLAGRVQDKEGQPIPNITVSVEITGSCGARAAALPPGFCPASSSSLQIQNAGEYTFAGTSLRIDGEAVNGAMFLKAGQHQIEIQTDPSQSSNSQLSWRGPDGLEQPIPPESLTASDPALQAISDASGAFRIPNVPTTAEAVRVRIALPDGRKGVSQWQSPINGAVTDTGNLTVRENR
jgi:YD repeat-containing protein